MKSNATFHRNAATLQRRGNAPRVAAGTVTLIVTEGEKTEPLYLMALRDHLRLSAAHIEIVHPEGTDPLTLVRRACELREERKRQSRRGDGVAYDEVWVVFDLEHVHDTRRTLAKAAMTLPEAKGLQFAISDPCFEYWLLLHYEYTTALFVGCDAVIKRLKKHDLGYAKEKPVTAELLQKIPTAVTHAMRGRKHHQTIGTSGCPTTQVDLLVRSLNDATRPHLRWSLPSIDSGMKSTASTHQRHGK